MLDPVRNAEFRAATARAAAEIDWTRSESKLIEVYRELLSTGRAGIVWPHERRSCSSPATGSASATSPAAWRSSRVSRPRSSRSSSRCPKRCRSSVARGSTPSTSRRGTPRPPTSGTAGSGPGCATSSSEYDPAVVIFDGTHSYRGMREAFEADAEPQVRLVAPRDVASRWGRFEPDLHLLLRRRDRARGVRPRGRPGAHDPAPRRRHDGRPDPLLRRGRTAQPRAGRGRA